jgi:hypothetical protein
MTISLRENLPKCLYCKEGFVDGKVMHQMNIEKVTKVIAKHRTSPDPTFFAESRHLWYQSRLGQDKLIHQDAIAGLKMLLAADGAGCLSFDLPRLTMRCTELTSNAKSKTTFAVKKTLRKKSKFGESENLRKGQMIKTVMPIH